MHAGTAGAAPAQVKSVSVQHAAACASGEAAVVAIDSFNSHTHTHSRSHAGGADMTFYKLHMSITWQAVGCLHTSPHCSTAPDCLLSLSMQTQPFIVVHTGPAQPPGVGGPAVSVNSLTAAAGSAGSAAAADQPGHRTQLSRPTNLQQQAQQAW